MYTLLKVNYKSTGPCHLGTRYYRLTVFNSGDSLAVVDNAVQSGWQVDTKGYTIAVLVILIQAGREITIKIRSRWRWMISSYLPSVHVWPGSRDFHRTHLHHVHLPKMEDELKQQHLLGITKLV